jgi:hypothetical protein
VKEGRKEGNAEGKKNGRKNGGTNVRAVEEGRKGSEGKEYRK